MLVWKAFYFSINFEWDLARYSNLGFRFFPLSTLNISCHSLLACRVSAERLAVKCMGFPLYVTCCFSLAIFNNLVLWLVFASLISMCFGVSPRVYHVWDSLCLLDLIVYFLFILGKFSTIISSKFFWYSFYVSSSSGIPIIQMLVHLISSLKSLRLSSVLSILFTLFCSSEAISTI